MTPLRAVWLTAAAGGAIAVLQVEGEPAALSKLLEPIGAEAGSAALGAAELAKVAPAAAAREFGTTPLKPPLPQVGEAALRRVCGLDEALVLRTGERTLLITPHGGPRLRQRLVRAMTESGFEFAAPEQLEPAAIYGEAEGKLEARMLRAIAQAASADAIPLLLAQPARWKKHGPPQDADLPRSRRLNRLIHPPTVVLAGPPNAGKSTLLNALVGRTAAVASPIAGTTRDFVAAQVDLAGLACRVVDAPGFDPAGDAAEAIDRAALARARRELASADLVLLLAAPGQPWLRIGHGCLLHARTMADLAIARAATAASRRGAAPASGSGDSAGDERDAMRVSAVTGEGVQALAAAVRERLVPAADLASNRPFQFEIAPLTTP
jgi:tRNA modification GTPase